MSPRTSRTLVLAALIALVLAGAIAGIPRLFQQASAPPSTSAAPPSPSPSPVEPKNGIADLEAGGDVFPSRPPVPEHLKFPLPPVVDGLAPVISQIPTEEPVVFLTIDDGVVKDPSHLEALKRNRQIATLFLAGSLLEDQADFFAAYPKAGYPVENHTQSHLLDLVNRPYETQRDQICSMADQIERDYGTRPTLFRPPGGAYTQLTQRAAAECGMRALVLWTAKANAGSMQYQVGQELHPGDIVLMHFRPEFHEDLAAFTEAQKAAGLRVELLNEWLVP